MPRPKTISAVIFAAFMLTGCVSNGAGGLIPDPKIETSVKNIGAFTITDLENADVIAVKSGDTQAHMCFPVLEAFVKAQQASANGAAGNTVSGAFSAFEATRTTLKAGNQVIDNATIQTLENACGPLVIDTQNSAANFMAKLAALGG